PYVYDYRESAPPGDGYLARERAYLRFPVGIHVEIVEPRLADGDNAGRARQLFDSRKRLRVGRGCSVRVYADGGVYAFAPFGESERLLRGFEPGRDRYYPFDPVRASPFYCALRVF